MFSNNDANYLLSLDKKVFHNDTLTDKLCLTQSFPFQHKFELIAPSDSDYTFLYDINQSAKNQFKLTLYLLDSDTRIGLLRIDFNGQHKNPEMITDKVPEFLHAYAGVFFDYNQPHIHYYVEGYKTTLDWAMPLSDDDFPVKQITKPNDITEAFYAFNKEINLSTNFSINPMFL